MILGGEMMWTWQWNSAMELRPWWVQLSPGHNGRVVYPTAASAVRAFDAAEQKRYLADHYRLLFGTTVIAELRRDFYDPHRRFRVVWK